MRALRNWKMVPLAFVLVALVLVSVLIRSWIVGSTWGAALAAGLMAGVFSVAARVMYRPAPTFSIVALVAVVIVFVLVGVPDRSLLPVSAFTTGLTVFVWYAAWDFWVTRAANREMPTEMSTLGQRGTAGRALIIHHPGRSGFHARLQHALASALVLEGWRVDIETANREAPIDLASIDLLVLGCPVYNWRVAEPLLAIVDRLGSLSGKRVALVLTGGGITKHAMADLLQLVSEAGAEVVETIEIWTERPNAPIHGLSDPEEIMRRAGKRIAARCRRASDAPVEQDDEKPLSPDMPFTTTDAAAPQFDRSGQLSGERNVS